jgi:isopentenyl diphosphate isomerase/L-lactate dehydrogenase-like FMN-dependent dehydrogenase
MLRDVSRRTLRVTLFGRELPAPVLLAPVGVQSIIHKEAERAPARAAAALGLPFVHSTAASTTIEEIAEAMTDGPRWYQLYWSRDPALNQSFLARAEQAGYQAVVVTLDTSILGWRPRDLELAYLPFLKAEGIANYLSDTVFRKSLPDAAGLDVAAAVKHFLGVFSSTAHTWADFAALRSQTRLPVLVKGVLHPEDAGLAVAHGADGVIVSNHGGRQVDGAVAALDALPGVVDAVQGRVPVLFDSGIRRGADAFKAIALGAKAVLLGRPYLYGMALAGEEGVREVLENFLAELDLTLALTGHTSFGELSTADVVAAHS